jgi:BirA family biotin operon repressor/biotin-[acetyl-CoA-carboxylase] ligase
LNVDTDLSELDPDLRETATSLRIETGGAVDRADVLAALLEALAARLRDVGPDAAGVLADYRQRDLLSGRRIAWTAGGRQLSGEARGIDEDGNLVVFTDEGERLTLSAGEVHLAVAGS